MRLPKLTALFLSLSIIVLISCKSTSELEQDNIYYGTLTMSGAQETPAVTTAATGTVEASYNKLTKTLSYKVTFSGLSGNATAAHIHGPGETGILAGVLQTFTGFPAKTSGTYGGTLLFEEVKILEADLLANRYYVNIHTAANPNGEIRAQLLLNKNK